MITDRIGLHSVLLQLLNIIIIIIIIIIATDTGKSSRLSAIVSQ